MPYSVEKKGEKWCVYNDDTGKKVGEHNDRTAAMKQMRALYANDDPAKQEGADSDDKKKTKKGKTAPESDSDYED